MILLFVGAAEAAPTEVEQRVRYTSSLNSMAAIVMNWYGSLITTKTPESFTAIENQWSDYRSHYAENITQIKITSTDLKKLDTDKYQFQVKSLINNKNPDGKHSELLSETFVFQVGLLAKPVIESVVRNKAKQTKTPLMAEFNRSHYKAREFAYAWLAYLDGVDAMQSTIYLEQWLNEASYAIKIGSNKEQGSIVEMLAKRKQYLTKGGHLLHGLKVKKLDTQANTFILDLVLEWKGVNQKGKSVLAKIHQEIEYTVQENNSWKVKSIKEQHLLPDIAPWSGLLC